MRERLIEELKIRIGYKEEILLTRDEFSLICDGDPALQKELEDEVESLTEYAAELENEEAETKELQEKLKRIAAIIEE